jgi:hypothetical protein
VTLRQLKERHLAIPGSRERVMMVGVTRCASREWQDALARPRGARKAVSHRRNQPIQVQGVAFLRRWPAQAAGSRGADPAENRCGPGHSGGAVGVPPSGQWFHASFPSGQAGVQPPVQGSRQVWQNG